MRKTLIVSLAVVAAGIASVSALAASPAPSTAKLCVKRSYFFSGSIISVGSRTLTVEVDQTGQHDPGLGGRHLNVRVNNSTQIVRDGRQIGFDRLILDEYVAVHALGCRDIDPGEQTLLATYINAGDRDVWFAGTVVSKGPDSLTVEVDRTGGNDGDLGGHQVAASVVRWTHVYLDGKPANLADITLRDRAAISAVGVADHFTAKVIRATSP